MGVLGLISDPGGSLKQPQHVKKVKNDADQKDALENAGLKRVILTILGCVLGVLGLILHPRGSLKQPQHVVLDPGGP